MSQIMTDNSESALTEEELQEVEKYYTTIDLSDSAAIIEYGLDVQKKLSELSERMLSGIYSQGMENIGSTLDTTVAYLRDIEEENNRVTLFRSKKQKNMREKYCRAKQNVDSLTDTLQKHQIQLMKNCALISQLNHMHTVFFRELKVRIIAADRKLNDCRLLLVQLQNKAAVSGLEQDVLEVVKLNTQIDKLEKRMQALLLTEAVSVQSEALIRFAQSNQTTMAQKLQTILLNTIPLWKEQMILAIKSASNNTMPDTNKVLMDKLSEVICIQNQKLKIEG
ncbi:MAG: toxic anion resistance protein [Lachnospiraceae bacterium]|nr:toxic anion resistance protein [Lachnospiraceae bacterium]